ncbi:hypothetical protein FOQG_01414 [Fusarium oxysporum f. sp. raphani 54005]|uniref:Secreted protein n=8 Tax=Fusarium oxysporum species complex TaxID=171631 RepID=X0CWI9_FUSOX|nr:hypothetical protein FOXG_18544 [Fusarium oxysporum f. sp. lycopersici 4287]XP_031052985.1 uncharacterized protein FOIG_15898 [Fusarium odoratissimum NRRL 54006]EXA40418.1 hypothetical protein FOVG_09260 [Fusarium oxysporum f. sp. pisi HDV247]EXK31001.1 hypothetical protein FOMG_12811 [Fusarium oxysporum f. sp. melonis 26406]EXK98536.1 hypothetical protein FOQG_01414 [Fusarium oxysporum f. sp. raphani 54005]EXL88532.1 hypothetical protein FOPG_00800 [Fusarium oxysporum f. sp. conglutinans r
MVLSMVLHSIIVVSFLTCPRISVPLATSTPEKSTPRCDTAAQPRPWLGLNLVLLRSAPLANRFAVLCTPPSWALHLACLLPTILSCIPGNSMHVYPRLCIKLLGILTLPVLPSLAS